MPLNVLINYAYNLFRLGTTLNITRSVWVPVGAAPDQNQVWTWRGHIFTKYVHSFREETSISTLWGSKFQSHPIFYKHQALLFKCTLLIVCLQHKDRCTLSEFCQNKTLDRAGIWLRDLLVKKKKNSVTVFFIHLFK